MLAFVIKNIHFFENIQNIFENSLRNGVKGYQAMLTLESLDAAKNVYMQTIDNQQPQIKQHSHSIHSLGKFKISMNKV